MKFIVCIAFLLFTASAMVAQTPAKPTEFDINTAERFGNLALACVHKEYPNKLSHTLNGDADVAPPRKLTPAFYGCYDWHSSVHGHWLLARLVKSFPNADFTRPAREALRQGLSVENITHGYCNSWRNCASGTILQRRRWRRICIRWRRLP